MYNDEDLELEHKMRRKKRSLERKKKMRRRRIMFYTLCILLIIIIIKVIVSIGSSTKSKETAIKMTLPLWMTQQVIREENGHYDNSQAKHLTMNDKFFIAYDKATGIRKRLAKNSNHITAANSYAYSAKTIREYIRGEKKYTGRDKIVFLTFDDGPTTNITPQILDILEKNKVHATFFVVGKSIVPQHYSILRRTIMEGNSIAIHSFSHDYHTLYPGKSADANKVIEEAKMTQNRLQKCFGKDFKSHVWRYPGGHMSWQNIDDADNALAKDGIEWIDWNCLTGDAERKAVRPTDTRGQVDYLDKSLNQNLHSDIAVVLMHDATNKQLTADSLNSVIKYFKEHNYKFGVLK